MQAYVHNASFFSDPICDQALVSLSGYVHNVQEAAAAAGTACSALQVQLEALQQRLQLLEQQQSQVVEDARLACAATVPGECMRHRLMLQGQ
jgi:hypothetical protein